MKRPLLILAYVSLFVLPQRGASQCFEFLKSGTTRSLNAIYFLDSATGWAVGDHGIVIHTTDAGTTWTRLTGPTVANLRAVSFSDPRHGITIGDTGSMFRTGNGGVSWVRTTRGSFYNGLGIKLLDSANAVLVDPGGPYRSTDGGITWWQTYRSSLATCMSFSPGSLIGFIAGSVMPILKTTDGGFSWFTAFSTRGNFSCLWALDDSNAIAGQYSGEVDWTHNGGLSWGGPTIDNACEWNGIAFENPVRGCVAGYSFDPLYNQVGRLAWTTDGGLTWTETPPIGGAFNAAAAAPGGRTFVAGQGGVILRSREDCPSVPSLVAPSDGNPDAEIVTLKGVTSVKLVWSFPPLVTLFSTRLQAGTDSTFAGGIIVDTTMIQGPAPGPTSVDLPHPIPGSTYCWRMLLTFLDSTTSGWAGPWRFTTARGRIEGVLFNDENGDSLRSPGEGPLVNWRLDLSGSVAGSVYSDSLGRFSIDGLPPGSYGLTEQPQAVWRQTMPSSAGYSITLAAADTFRSADFGNQYPWNIISGMVFRDKDENGTQGAGEPGLAGWTVKRAYAGGTDSTRTDSTGAFLFPHVDPGSQIVTVAVAPGWEQVAPLFNGGYVLDIQTYGGNFGGETFGMRGTPARARVGLKVRDFTGAAMREVFLGVRPGASYGIWGVDPRATNFDFSEGELEIPPPTPGLFDARFVDPHGGLSRFGYGSWTDIRDFRAVEQLDTFLLTFAPATLFGGNYPMFIDYPTGDVYAGFPSGGLYATDRYGDYYSIAGCCATETIRIDDSTITWLKIIAGSPNISPSLLRKWRLLSMPDAAQPVAHAYPSADTRGYAYVPGSGYTLRDSLLPGPAYWLHYRLPLDTVFPGNPTRTSDSLSLLPGWNLVGALGVPLPVTSASTEPPGIAASSFYGYNHGYFVADTLHPVEGYWLKASAPGMLYLGGAARAAPKEVADPAAGAGRIAVRDRAGNEGLLFVAPAAARIDGPLNTVPPVPPEGSFDARFASGKLVERGGELSVAISGAVLPLEVTWLPAPGDLRTVKLRGGAADVPLLPGKPVRVPSLFGGRLAVVIADAPFIPAAYSLAQNYPNPFNPSTTVVYDLPAASNVAISIFDILGRRVTLLRRGVEEAGRRSVEWRAEGVPSGVYYCRFEASPVAGGSPYTAVRKMLLIR